MPDPPDLPAWLFALSVTVLTLMVMAWGVVIQRTSRGQPLLKRRRRERVPWGWEATLLVGLFLLNAVVSLAVVAAQPTAEPAPIGADAVDESAEADAPTIDFGAVATQGAVCGFFVVMSLVALAARGPLRRGHFGLGSPLARLLGDLPLGVLATAFMLPLVLAFSQLLVWCLGPPILHPAIESLRETPSIEVVTAIILMATVLAPLVEEFAFRVLLQGWLERYAGRRAWWPIGVSALAFAFSHTNQGYAPLPLFVLAVGFGYVYRQTHSYPAVVAMHMAFNAFSLAVAFGTAVPPAS